MAFTWSKDLEFTPWDLDVIERDCPSCGRMMYICDHRHRHFFTLDGPGTMSARPGDSIGHGDDCNHEIIHHDGGEDGAGWRGSF